MSAYSAPENDSDTLYIDGDFGSMSFGKLAERILEHFGPVQLDQLELQPQSIITGGCSCCSYEKTTYLVVSRVSEPCHDTVTHQPTVLIHEPT